MIVWDSREAEERNARQLLAERSRDLRRARWRVRRRTIELALLPLGVVGCIVVALYWRTPLTGLTSAALGTLIYVEFQARRRATRVLPFHERRPRYAQENHDRVFGATSDLGGCLPEACGDHDVGQVPAVDHDRRDEPGE
jgi:hypothetical protein